MLIAIAGTDGSGKYTQAQLLKKAFEEKGQKAVIISFPRYHKKSSRLVKQYLSGEFGQAEDIPAKATSALFSFDRYMAAPEIRKYKKKGVHIILDRYVCANKGHQLAKLKTDKEKKDFLKWLNHLEYELNGLPKPDFTFFLYLPLKYHLEKETSRKKGGVKNDIHEKDLNHLKAAEKAYLWTIKHDKSENWIKIPCVRNGKRLTRAEVQEEIIKKIF